MSNKKLAFVSRHVPTQGQNELANDMGFDLVHVGDLDAFAITPEMIAGMGQFDGVVVVHPAAALRLAKRYVIGVFENANRAPVGEKPQFEAVDLHIYNLVG